MIYEEFETGLKGRTATLTQKLKLTSGELEEEHRQKEALQELALKAVIDAGIPEAQARNQLGLD